jgi:hypothetical protein
MDILIYYDPMLAKLIIALVKLVKKHSNYDLPLKLSYVEGVFKRP